MVSVVSRRGGTRRGSLPEGTLFSESAPTSKYHTWFSRSNSIGLVASERESAPHAESMGTRMRTLPNAFAFDIDGVLLHGKTPIGGAVEALKLLLAKPRGGGFSETSGWRLPVAFLTNGGGVTEQAKAEELTDLLRLPASGGYRPSSRSRACLWASDSGRLDEAHSRLACSSGARVCEVSIHGYLRVSMALVSAGGEAGGGRREGWTGALLPNCVLPNCVLTSALSLARCFLCRSRR